MRHLQRDGGERPGQTSVEKARIKELEREERELRQGEEGKKTIRGIVFPTNEILRKASAYFAQAELDRPFRA
jgi:transposase